MSDSKVDLSSSKVLQHTPPPHARRGGSPMRMHTPPPGGAFSVVDAVERLLMLDIKVGPAALQCLRLRSDKAPGSRCQHACPQT